MKHIFSTLAVLFSVMIFSQTTANRFFYELTFKPGIKVDSLHKEMTILDILPAKSIYQDYLMVSQDSILKIEMDRMIKSGSFKDISKSIRQPKFSHKVTKVYPDFKIIYSDNILNNKASYEENLKLNWKMSSEKQTIGTYKTQKATTDFGGRSWTAWFTTDIPFQDGPYKFHGLPGLIVKLSDSQGEYSWELKGNRKVENYNEESYTETLQKQFNPRHTSVMVSREKFEQMYSDYRKDPFASIRMDLANIPADFKMPDGTLMSDMIKTQEAMLKKHLNENDNTIERAPAKAADKPKKGKK